MFKKYHISFYHSQKKFFMNQQQIWEYMYIMLNIIHPVKSDNLPIPTTCVHRYNVKIG